MQFASSTAKDDVKILNIINFASMLSLDFGEILFTKCVFTFNYKVIIIFHHKSIIRPLYPAIRGCAKNFFLKNNHL